MPTHRSQNAIQPTRAKDYNEWYQQVVKEADLAEPAQVRGCMIVKPWGFAIWENIQRQLDKRLRAAGHQNVYLPLLIPLSLIQKEADHVKGFAKECAVVTHHRLQAGPGGELLPASPLEEPLIIRPTSEALVGGVFARWVQSYRDLPLKINQWANIVRWEMRPRLFLRTSEFLWQEGHSAHATAEEARAESLNNAQLYEDFLSQVLALPTIAGEKTPRERFPGAIATYTLEGMMQDGKALQLGTSHDLGQNFAKSADIFFNTPGGQRSLAHTTSWGVSTRMIGGLIMTHSDDDGLVLPPSVAPAHVVLLPMLHKPDHREAILAYCHSLKKQLEELRIGDRHVEVEIDQRELRGGEKLWSWIKRGVPLWIEIGPHEIETNLLSIGRRDQPRGEKLRSMRKALSEQILDQLQVLQKLLLERAQAQTRERICQISTEEQLSELFHPSREEVHKGFALCHWCGDESIEVRLAEQFKVTMRCLPFAEKGRPGICIFTGRPSSQRVLIGKAY